jgi:transcriptional regulator with XRE-family HTH domain
VWRLRMEKGLAQERLAEMCGLTGTTWAPSGGRR